MAGKYALCVILGKNGTGKNGHR